MKILQAIIFLSIIQLLSCGINDIESTTIDCPQFELKEQLEAEVISYANSYLEKNELIYVLANNQAMDTVHYFVFSTKSFQPLKSDCIWFGYTIIENVKVILGFQLTQISSTLNNNNAESMSSIHINPNTLHCWFVEDSLIRKVHYVNSE